MWLAGLSHAYFVVQTQGGNVFVEKIELDSDYITPIVRDAGLFFKTYVLPVLLGYRSLYFCASCDKVVLEQSEVNTDEENSVCCDSCDLWWHMSCANVTSDDVAGVEWICKKCIEDMVSTPIDTVPENLNQDEEVELKMWG